MKDSLHYQVQKPIHITSISLSLAVFQVTDKLAAPLALSENPLGAYNSRYQGSISATKTEPLSNI